ncbi:hypothetical protein [Halarchaeum sp. P4]|uniref:hypothetical protein n=1 Tax=Halarchaeum sp. P4 TaxID=3421639 RepID=UPI003EBE673D
MADNDKFTYEGTLVFNGIYRTISVDSDDLDGEKLSELTSFDRGTPGEEKSGFKQIELSNYFDRYDAIKPSLKKVASETLIQEFKSESYNQPDELVDEEGDPTSGWERSTNSSYFHWDNPDYAFFQGSHGKVSDLKERLHEDWSGEVELEPLTIKPDFLLYLLKKYDEDERLNGISISNLSDVRMSGDIGAYGEENEVRNSLNATHALPVIAGILLNYEIREIEGRFSFEDYDITANIQTNVRDYTTGRIHVKVENSIDDSPHLIRMLLSLYFLRRLIRLYDEWTSLDPTEKYVSPKFFAKLHRRAADLPQSAEYDFPLSELVTDYAEKRGEDPSKYSDLEWGSHEENN